MAQGNLAKLFIAFLIGGAVIAGLALWIGDMGVHYSFTSNSTTLDKLVNKSAAIYAKVGDAESTTTNQTITPETGLSNPWSGAWDAVLDLINSPSTMATMIDDMFVELFPSAASGWFIAVIASILLSIGIFAVIYVLTGRQL